MQVARLGRDVAHGEPLGAARRLDAGRLGVDGGEQPVEALDERGEQRREEARVLHRAGRGRRAVRAVHHLGGGELGRAQRLQREREGEAGEGLEGGEGEVYVRQAGAGWGGRRAVCGAEEGWRGFEGVCSFRGWEVEWR